jgi:hypothetical protein
MTRLLVNTHIALNPQTIGLNGWLAVNGAASESAAGVGKILRKSASADAIGRAARDYVEEKCA